MRLCVPGGRTVCWAGARLLLALWPTPASADDRAEVRQLILAVRVNQETVSDAESIFVTAPGHYWLPDSLLDRARLRAGEGEARQFPGFGRYREVVTGGDLQAEVLPSQQLLSIDAQPSAFRATRLDLRAERALAVDRPASGGYLNYDLQARRTQGHGFLAGLLEQGLFRPQGSLRNRLVMVDGMEGRALRRLDSQFVRESPDDVATLTVGDAITPPGAWWRAVYFAGLQWQTDYATRPDLLPMPLPSIGGMAAAPSTVELYVDNVLRQQRNVETGPFALSNVPVLSEQGRIQMVVRDALGRQQVIEQSFVASQRLVRPGMTEQAWSVGVPRQGIGTAEDRYAGALAMASVRRGLDPLLTAGLHAEGGSGFANLGAGFTRAVEDLGVISAEAAVSTAHQASGRLATLQFERQGSRAGVAMQAQLADPGFRQAGLAPDLPLPAVQWAIQANAAARERVHLSLNLLEQRRRQGADVRSLSLAANVELPQRGVFAANLFRNYAPQRSTGASLVWTMPMEQGRFAQAGTTRASAQAQWQAGLQQLPGPEGGWGWQLRQGAGPAPRSDAGARYHSEFGDFGLAAAAGSGGNDLQLDARGGVAAIDGHVLATRFLDRSFAVVELPLPLATDLYANNVKVGRTRADGVGIVPDLVAFQPNQVGVAESDLPIQVQFDVAQRTVTPPSRSGVVLHLSLNLAGGATVILRDASGAPLPPGTLVEVPDQPGLSDRVALRGEVFLGGVHLPALLVARTGQGTCRVQAPVPVAPGPLPRIGPLTCVAEAEAS